MSHHEDPAARPSGTAHQSRLDKGRARHRHEGDRHAHHDGHEHASRPWARLTHALARALTPHSHDAADSMDRALESSTRGVRAVKISLVGLGVTAVLQLLVVSISGSVALLADTVHNFSDALTAVPLGIAFVIGRRAATRRYTYGYGRAEDLAGLFVIAMIALSAVIAGWEAIDRLLNPTPSAASAGWPSPASSASSATRPSPCSASARARRLDQPPWSPTATTPALTA
jgi:hypothetical protein